VLRGVVFNRRVGVVESPDPTPRQLSSRVRKSHAKLHADLATVVHAGRRFKARSRRRRRKKEQAIASPSLCRFAAALDIQALLSARSAACNP